MRVQRSLGNCNGTQKKSVVLHLKGSRAMWWWRVRVNLHQQSPVIVFQRNHNKKHRFSLHANKICMSLHQTFNNKAFFCWLQLQLSVITPTHAVVQRMQSSVFNHTTQACSSTQSPRSLQHTTQACSSHSHNTRAGSYNSLIKNMKIYADNSRKTPRTILSQFNAYRKLTAPMQHAAV